MHLELASAILTAPIAPPGSDKIDLITSWIMWIAYALGIVAVIIAGGIMMFQNRRGEGGEAAGRLGWVAAGLIVIGCAAAIVKALQG